MMRYENVPYLYLTTTGRKSGKPHTIEIWFVDYEGSFYLCSEGKYETDWVKNIQQTPAITFRLEEMTYSGMGRIVEAAAEPALAAEVATRMEKKYQWSDGLFVELRLLP